MDEKFYQMFYTKAVLPQFGLMDLDVAWGERKVLGPDEWAWAFQAADRGYVLIYEDYDGLGRHPEYVKEHVTGSGEFEFVEPTSRTSNAPSYNGFKLPPPSRYVADITGTYTLIRLIDKETK